ncbi:hypothetical protein QTN25_002852 [Entamoeba marina]
MSLEAFTVSASAPHTCISPEGAYFNLRHVTLEGDSKTQLFMKNDGDEILVCTLNATLPQHSVDLPLYSEEIEFIAKGNGTLHIVGNFDDIEDEFGDESIDSEELERLEEAMQGEEDEEEEEEEIEEKQPEKKKPQPPKQEKKPQPSKQEKKSVTPKQEKKSVTPKQEKKSVTPKQEKKNKKHGKH